MELPNIDSAIIDSAKLRDYLLSPSHPLGRFKARFFESLGYSQTNADQLEADLRAHVAAGSTTLGSNSPYGQKYQVVGQLQGPSGRIATVVSIWIVRSEEAMPRFVTAYPGT